MATGPTKLLAKGGTNSVTIARTRAPAVDIFGVQCSQPTVEDYAFDGGQRSHLEIAECTRSTSEIAAVARSKDLPFRELIDRETLALTVLTVVRRAGLPTLQVYR